jgi:putative ABC transport system permease protein
MGEGAVTTGPALAALLVLLMVFGALVGVVGGLGEGRAIVTASLRAGLQLTAVSLVITAVLRSWPATAGFIALMVVVAALTSARRVGMTRSGWPALLAIVLGALPVTAVVMAAGTMPLTPVTVLPVAGILIGGAMTATSLAGQRALDELRQRHGEYEAGLALGFTEREAVLEVCRPTAGRALVPALDQTRTVGLVTLPGAFVGVLLGGGSAVQAGATQLLVLVALLAVEAVSAAVVLHLVAIGSVRPPERSSSARES